MTVELTLQPLTFVHRAYNHRHVITEQPRRQATLHNMHSTQAELCNVICTQQHTLLLHRTINITTTNAQHLPIFTYNLLTTHTTVKRPRQAHKMTVTHPNSLFIPEYKS